MRFAPLLLAVLLLLAGCSSSRRDDVPLGDISLALDVKRLDLDMYRAAAALRRDSGASDSTLTRQFLLPHRSFIADWYFMGMDSLATDSFISDQFLRGFLRDSLVWQLLDSVHSHFPDKFDLTSRLLNPLKRFHHHFPNKPAPAIETYVSGFPRTLMEGTDELYLSDRFLGIGLHFFLGPDIAWYPPDMPVFMRRRFDERFLEVHIFRMFADQVMDKPRPGETPTLLEEMLRSGKRLYFLDRITPETPDSLKIFYTDKQWEWAVWFEGRIYRDLLPHLYEKSPAVLQEYVAEKPFTSGLVRESAPRIGEFAGWMMVRAYMEQHPELSLDALMQEKDAEKVLRESKYKPKPRD